MIEMTLGIAEQAARAALSKAATMNLPITVSVVDEAGRLVLTLRGDRTGFFTTETSRAKAAAAAAFKRTTRELVELQKTNPVFWAAVPAISRSERVLCGGRGRDRRDQAGTTSRSSRSASHSLLARMR